MDEDAGHGRIPWLVAWDQAPPGWAAFMHLDMPRYLRVMVRTALTPDGVAAEAALVERTDGRALTAQDLRKVKLPRPWMLARGRELTRSDDLVTVTAAKPGARGTGDDHWRAVLRLLAEAERVAPRTPVRRMREQWPYPVADPTMRRWVKLARERARAGGRDG